MTAPRSSQEPRFAGLRPDATPLPLSEEPPRRDDEHVAAVLKIGGYPRALINERGRTEWVDFENRRWGRKPRVGAA